MYLEYAAQFGTSYEQKYLCQRKYNTIQRRVLYFFNSKKNTNGKFLNYPFIHPLRTLPFLYLPDINPYINIWF